MLNLLLAIIFSAVIPIILKHAHHRNLAEEVILTFNYIIATLVSIVMAFFKYFSRSFPTTSSKDFLILTLIGMVTGLMYYGAFYFYQKSVKDNGVSISIAVGKMGIIIPMLLSIILWQELPSPMQWLAIIISFTAILIINVQLREIKKSHVHLSLLLFFLIGGLGDFGNKLFETLLGAKLSEVFLIVVFATALLASSIITIRLAIKKKSISKESILFGIMVGIPNMLTAYFLILSLADMKAALVFPIYSGGAIVLSMLYSVLRFKERLMIKDILSIFMILLALLLINR